MKEYMIIFKKGLEKGLRATSKNPRTVQALVESQGAYPSDGVLRALDDLSSGWLDTSTLTVAFPYPQIFVFTYLTLVFTEDQIYEYRAGAFELVFAGAPVGTTWSVADYGQYVIATNGACLVTKSPLDGTWTLFTGCEVPQCVCLCDLNGQLIVGAPGQSVTAGWRG